MPRFIPPQLKGHLQGEETTTCYLLRIQSVKPGYDPYGVTSLDIDIEYDDGRGTIVYSAPIGVQMSAMQAVANLGIDNAQASSLMPEYDVPISEADIRAGVYDYATFDLYLVNWSDLSQGHVLLRSGTIGEVTIDQNGLSFATEFRGLGQTLRQSVCEKDSLSCRAIFGSQREGDSTGGPVVSRGWCGFDAQSLLETASVSSVGAENTLTFTISPFPHVADYLNPGIITFLTGLNAGRTYEVDTNTAGGVITLSYETDFPIQNGDSLEYRPDCSKLARDSEKGCLHWFGSEWTLHFRGEPDIPIGDAGVIEIPGAGAPPGHGGSTNIPISEEAE